MTLQHSNHSCFTSGLVNMKLHFDKKIRWNGKFADWMPINIFWQCHLLQIPCIILLCVPFLDVSRGKVIPIWRPLGWSAGWPGESARRDEVRQSFSGHWRKPSETLRAGLRHFGDAALVELLGFFSGAGGVFFFFFFVGMSRKGRNLKWRGYHFTTWGVP